MFLQYPRCFQMLKPREIFVLFTYQQQRHPGSIAFLIHWQMNESGWISIMYAIMTKQTWLNTQPKSQQVLCTQFVGPFLGLKNIFFNVIFNCSSQSSASQHDNIYICFGSQGSHGKLASQHFVTCCLFIRITGITWINMTTHNVIKNIIQ